MDSFRTVTCVSIALVYAIGCASKSDITQSVSNANTLNEYLPLKTGNAWTYKAFSILHDSPLDTVWVGTQTFSVFQTNALVGGQPNAFILETDRGSGTSSFLAFNTDATTLWHYLGSGSTLPFAGGEIRWVPGGYSGAVVETHGSQSYHIADPTRGSSSFVIIRSPEQSIATAVMTAQDTLTVTGVAPGQTLVTLGRSGSSPDDTMSILLATLQNTSVSLDSPLPPWIPLYKLTKELSGETLFLKDTTYTFRLMDDSSTCSDRLEYTMTNRYVGEESLPFRNALVQCSRVQLTMVVDEIITYTKNGMSQVLFDGPSTHFTVDTWIAKGIGFVRMTFKGNSRSPFAVMGGAKTANGTLDGFYISPRVTYASVSTGPTARVRMFFIDDAPLELDGIQTGSALSDTNF